MAFSHDKSLSLLNSVCRRAANSSIHHTAILRRPRQLWCDRRAHGQGVATRGRVLNGALADAFDKKHRNPVPRKRKLARNVRPLVSNKNLPASPGDGGGALDMALRPFFRQCKRKTQLFSRRSLRECGNARTLEHASGFLIHCFNARKNRKNGCQFLMTRFGRLDRTSFFSQCGARRTHGLSTMPSGPARAKTHRAPTTWQVSPISTGRVYHI